MKKNLNIKRIWGIIIFLTVNFLVLNSFYFTENNLGSVGIFNQDENHLKLSADLPGTYFHRETPTSFVEFPTSPNINTYFYGTPVVATAVKNDDGNWAGVGISVPGYFGVNFSGYSNFDSSKHDDIRYINITYEITFTYNIEVDSEDLVLNFHCDDGTTQGITLFETADDYIELEGSLIINEANLDQIFTRVKDGGYIESFSLSATTFASGGQFIYVDYLDIYYYYPLRVTHDPIVITDDSEFTFVNGVIDGTGTYSDPFIIGNWSINAGWSGSSIDISGTTAYFTIENCILINSGNSGTDAGIRLENSTNGRIFNNNIFNNLKNGIYLTSCKNFSISKNIVFNNSNGIYLYGSNNTEFSDNNSFNNSNGIFMVYSNFCEMYRNNLSNNAGVGLNISTSKNNKYYYNFISHNEKAVELYDSTENYIYENWIWNNNYYVEGSIDGNYIYNNYFFSIEEHDTDGDGLTDIEEFTIGTNPSLVDTDGDNFIDGYEDDYGSDPLDPNDYPKIWKNDFDTLMTYLNGNTTLLQQVINWYTKLEGYMDGNATALAEVIINVNNNATLLNTVYALATQNGAYLSQINGTLSSSIDDIQTIIDELGITIGDTDYDGLDDLGELTHGTDPTMIDTDLDNLNDAFEIKYGTDPLDDDSDDDGHFDGIEVASGTDPLDADDYPGRVAPGGGINIPLIIGTIIGVVSAITVGILAGTFFYLKKRKVE